MLIETKKTRAASGAPRIAVRYLTRTGWRRSHAAWDYALNLEGNHRAAAETVARLQIGPHIGPGLSRDTGSGWVHLFEGTI